MSKLTAWNAPWWHAHLTGIAMAFIGIVAIVLISVIWDKLKSKKPLAGKHKGQRKKSNLIIPKKRREGNGLY